MVEVNENDIDLAYEKFLFHRIYTNVTNFYKCIRVTQNY